MTVLKLLRFLGLANLLASAAVESKVNQSDGLEDVPDLEDLHEMILSFQRAESKRLSKGRPFKLHEFNQLDKWVATLMAEIVEGKRTGLKVEDVLPLQGYLEDIRLGRLTVKEGPVPEEEDSSPRIEEKSGELEETLKVLATGGDSSDGFSRLDKLEEFFSSLNKRYTHIRKEKLDAINHLRRLARKTKRQEDPLLAAEEAPGTFSLSKRGCKDALDWMIRQLRVAEGSLSKTKDMIASMEDAFAFLKACHENDFAVSAEKYSKLRADADRLIAFASTPDKEIQALMKAIPEALTNLEIDLLEKLVADFARLLDYRRMLPMNKDQKSLLLKYENTVGHTRSHLPRYRAAEAKLKSIIASLGTIEDDLHKIKQSASEALYLPMLTDMFEWLKASALQEQRRNILMKRIIKLKVYLSTSS